MLVQSLAAYLTAGGINQVSVDVRVADEYAALSSQDRHELVSALSASERVRPEDAGWFILNAGGFSDLEIFCAATDLQGHDRDYLLHVYQSVAGDVERGFCDDPRPLLLRVADIPAACDCRWSHHVYELILSRHPTTALLLWRRFLDITSDPEQSAEYLDLWARDSIDATYASINDEGPHGILQALRQSGFFAGEAAKSEWWQSLIRMGSASAVLMVSEILAEANLVAPVIESIESEFQGLSGSLVLVGQASGDERLASIGSALQLISERYAITAETTLAASGVR